MAPITEFLINAAAISALYALVAIGFTLIFGVGNILNFAHGAFITFGAFMAYVVSTPGQDYAMSPWLGLLAGTVLTAILGGLVYWAVIQYVRDRPVTVLIITLVGGYFIQHALRIVYGATSITVVRPWPGQEQILGQSVQHLHIIWFVTSWILIAAMLAFVNYTKTGKAILATSMSQKGAALVGINSNRVNLYTWIAAAMLAGYAGVLLAAFEGGSWNMGTDPLVLSFSIVILGGLGSIRGSIVGAYVIGFLETATTTFIDARLTGLAALVMLVVVLLIRPSGLFGREVEM